MRCPGGVDPRSSIHPNSSAQQSAADTNPPNARYCRYCGKMEPHKKPFVNYYSPHDQSGANAHKPPSLRTTSWCVAHNRPWLAGILSEQPTRYALAHILARSVPTTDLTAQTITGSAEKGLSHTQSTANTQGARDSGSGRGRKASAKKRKLAKALSNTRPKTNASRMCWPVG